MPYQRIVAAGTTVLSASPGMLESIFAHGGTFGAVKAYDGNTAGAAAGTPIFAYNPTGTADIALAKGINIPFGTGIVVLAAAATQVTYVYNTQGRKS